MEAKGYVEQLFAKYEQTQEIQEFKEEITVNLTERIEEYQANGLDAQSAFAKATAELGDMSEIADMIGMQKRNETLGDMYIQTKKITKKHALGYVVSIVLAVVAVLGIGMLIFGFDFFLPLIAAVTFGGVAVGGFTYFGLTQETRSNYPMAGNRAIWYAVGTAMTSGGLLFIIGTFLQAYINATLATTFSTMLFTFVIVIVPFAGLLIFLLMTQEKRHKPWLAAIHEAHKAMHENHIVAGLKSDADIEKAMQFVENGFTVAQNHGVEVDPTKAAKFGIMSGALWTLAIALFITFGFAWSWAYSWIIFLFTIPVQLVMITQIFVSPKK